MFTSAVAVVLGAKGTALPPEFANDRGRLYFGENYDYEAVLRDLPHQLGQLRAQFRWLEEHLASDRQFVSGDAPGLPDALAYYLVWFLRGRYEHGPALIDSFPNLAAWEARVDALGHGYPTELDSREALEFARAATPDSIADPDPEDPQLLEAGQRVAVSSVADDGTDPVIGPLATLASDEIALRHKAPEVGEVVIHFPRVGYRIEAA
jgi:glutathione S-transferase